MTVYMVKKIKRTNNIKEYWERVKNAPAHYCNGISELRKYCGSPLHYSNNGKAYIGHSMDFEYVARKAV